ncbi:MAG: M23 family metallopeptidase [Clostridia bacterium]|nr:M23 family metallopeptidase [Clostridia bacterium]
MKKRRLYHIVWDEIEEIREEEQRCRETLRRRGKSRLLGAAALAAASFAVFFGLGMEPAVALTVDGERIACAKDLESYEECLESLMREAEKALETELLTDNPTLSLTIAPSYAIDDTEEIQDRILECSPVNYERRYAFYLGDRLLGTIAPDRVEEARAKVEDYRARVIAEYDWADEVAVTGNPREELRLSSEDEFITPEELYAALEEIDGATERYTLKVGEDYQDVMSRFSLDESTLTSYNPEKPLSDYRWGNEIVVSASGRVFDVTCSFQTSYTETIPFDITYKNTRTLLVGEEGVRTEGISGLTEIQAAMTMTNGKITSREVLSETVIREPQAAVHLKGVRKDTGKMFYVPVDNARISSEFGYRTLFGGRDYHTGVDFVVPEGTYVYAAADGVVKSSGIIGNGAYGRVVVIDHENGFVTYYAHNSKLLVKVGDRVVKGVAIALSGNTGRSTGPHCHFEVRKNGVQINPFQYMERP